MPCYYWTGCIHSYRAQPTHLCSMAVDLRRILNNDLLFPIKKNRFKLISYNPFSHLITALLIRNFMHATIFMECYCWVATVFFFLLNSLSKNHSIELWPLKKELFSWLRWKSVQTCWQISDRGTSSTGLPSYLFYIITQWGFSDQGLNTY